MRIGSIELKIQRNVQYTGRKASPGKICFDEDDRMVVQVGYCPDCNAKINMTLHDARVFARLYGEEQNKKHAKRLNKLVNQTNYEQ